MVNALRVIAPDLPFEIQFRELKEKTETIEMNGYRIRAFRVNHNVVCYGYTIEIPRVGRFDVDRAKENGIEMKYWSRLQKGETIALPDRVLTSDMVLGPRRKGIKCTYTTDTRPAQVIAQEAKDADLFICEGMYGEADKKDKAIEKKHMTFIEAAELARQAKPKEMWLTHYSPALVYPENFMSAVHKIFPASKAGKDGMSLTLRFEEDQED